MNADAVSNLIDALREVFRDLPDGMDKPLMGTDENGAKMPLKSSMTIISIGKPEKGDLKIPKVKKGKKAAANTLKDMKDEEES